MTLTKVVQDKHTKLFKELGVFFAFSTEQLKEGIEANGGIEKTGKYVSLPHGMVCPKKNITSLLDGLDQIRKEWEQERKQTPQIRLKWVGVDNWNRPVWKAPDKREYYGSVNQLFSYEDTEETVLKKVSTYELCYFGNHFGCEPMGTPVPNQYYI
jgi:hypothetical protein